MQSRDELLGRAAGALRAARSPDGCWEGHLSSSALSTATAVTALALHVRAGYWRNLVDPSNRFIQPRNSDGSWANPTAVGPVNLPYNPNFQDGYQYLTTVVYNPEMSLPLAARVLVYGITNPAIKVVNATGTTNGTTPSAGGQRIELRVGGVDDAAVALHRGRWLRNADVPPPGTRARGRPWS